MVRSMESRNLVHELKLLNPDVRFIEGFDRALTGYTVGLFPKRAVYCYEGMVVHLERSEGLTRDEAAHFIEKSIFPEFAGIDAPVIISNGGDYSVRADNEECDSKGCRVISRPYDTD